MYVEVIFLASLWNCGTALKVVNHLCHNHCPFLFFTLHNKVLASHCRQIIYILNSINMDGVDKNYKTVIQIDILEIWNHFGCAHFFRHHLII